MKIHISPNVLKVLLANIGLVLLQFVYVASRMKYLNGFVPLWYTMPWGTQQLASKESLFLIPSVALLVIVLSAAFVVLAKKRFLRYGEEFICVFTSICNILLAYSIFTIVQIASSPFPPMLNPNLVQLFPAMLSTAILVFAATPRMLGALKTKGLITDPQVHKHPGMLLTKPSVRGGGLVFTLGVLIASLFFLRITPTTFWILVSVCLGAGLGILDDIQNTSPVQKLKFIENPTNRMILQAVIVLPLIFAGVQVLSINNPFGGTILFNQWQLNVLGTTLFPVAIAFTLVWILWIMNVLSWSNGVDGQFAGIVGIAAIVLALITMREVPLNLEQKEMITLAAIVAGAAFGLLPYTWHPSKILWGFGAISAGILLATISTLTKAKIAAALIVLAVPFLDGVVTVIRRVLQGKSPLKGDRGHFHHMLLERGWSVQKVAIFYWLSTLITGFIGVSSADKDPMLAALTLGGVVAFIIMIANIRKSRAKKLNGKITQLASDPNA